MTNYHDSDDNLFSFSHSVFQTLLHVYRDNGVAGGLYRGMTLNYVKAVPYWGVTFAVHEYVMQRLEGSS
jgi:hypothetical protein